jgi:hypothetical protein
MKIFLSIFLMLITGVNSFSQDWLYFIQAKGIVNSTFIVNNAVISDKNQSNAFALGGNGGIGASIIYDNTVGASVDVLFGTHTANYTGKYNVGPIESSYTSKVKLTTVQIPILFRLDSEEGYLEIGPQLNVITSANYSSNSPIFMDNQVMDAYKKTSWSGVLGVGSFRQLGRRSPLSVSFGLRVNYGLTNIQGVTPTGALVVNLPNKEKSILFAGGFCLGIIYQLNYR